MIQPYNYSRKFLDYTDHEGWVSAKNHKAKEMANVVRGNIEVGVKYILPPEGDTGITIKNPSQYMELIRLPYTCVALEVPLTCWKDDESNSFTVPTIIALRSNDGEDLGFQMAPVQYHGNMHSKSDTWSMSKFAAIINERDIKTWDSKKLSEIDFEIFTMDKETAPSESLDEDCEENTHFKGFYGRLMQISLEFCIYANTRNIGVETIHAPHKLNKKRAKRGLKPLYDYKVLGIHKQVIKAGGIGGGDSHKNRWHRVCGHPRFLKGHDKPIWIKSHSRGDETLGVVEKIYKVNL
jgi:hypothetical protein